MFCYVAYDILVIVEYVSIDDFLKVDLRTGVVINAEVVSRSKKLLRLEVDIGEDKLRQIIAGIATFVSPTAIRGKKCIIVANLESKKLAGLESQGMLLASSYENEAGNKHFALVQAKDIPPGYKVR